MHKQTDGPETIFSRLTAKIPSDLLDQPIALRSEAPAVHEELFGHRAPPQKLRRCARHANAYGITLDTSFLGHRRVTSRRALIEYYHQTEIARRAAEDAEREQASRAPSRRQRTDRVLAEHGLGGAA